MTISGFFCLKMINFADFLNGKIKLSNYNSDVSYHSGLERN